MKILSNDKNTSFSFVTLGMLRKYEKLKDTQFCGRRERQAYNGYLQPSALQQFLFWISGLRSLSHLRMKKRSCLKEKKILYYKNQSVNVM
jgi:hypothetical protein